MIIQVVILIAIILYIINYNFIENFINGYTDFLFNNVRLGQTRNMSYDLRGDPLVIPKTEMVWNNATTFPIYNEGI